MICFQVVKTVLDDLYLHIPGNSAQKDQDILSRLDRYSKDYSDIANAPDIEYEDTVSRFAYVYRYVASHADLVYQLIVGCPELTALFTKSHVSIACLGGGPGSDFAGVLKYIALQQVPPKGMCFILDREKAWNQCWADIAKNVSCPFSSNFVPIDACVPRSYQYEDKFLEADLFTMVYFVSEVYKCRQQAEPFFERVFRSANDGAILLYVDNDHTKFDSWFDGLCRPHGFEVLSEGRGRMTASTAEEKTLLGQYFDKFGPPKLNPSVCWRVLRKER